MGSMMIGCIPAGMYCSSSPDMCHFIVTNSESEVLVVDTNAQLKKFFKIPPCSVKMFVLWGEDIDETVAQDCSAPVMSWNDFRALGENVSDSVIDARVRLLRPGNCAVLVYTSGTTGPPKSVMISHDNVTWMARNINENYFDSQREDRFISYLPLCHVAAYMMEIFIPAGCGGCAYFAPDALRGNLISAVRDVRPTIFLGVPRVYEKIMSNLKKAMMEQSGLKKLMIRWAQSVSAECSRRAEYGETQGVPVMYRAAHALVLSNVKKLLGFDKLKGAYVSAAPIALSTLQFFASLDIRIYEILGLSESTGPHTVSCKNAWKMGTCGRPMKGTQSRILPSGELCYTGRHVFMGYMNQPDATEQAIDKEGFLHTGDVCSFDSNNDQQIAAPSGFLTITGRVKEIIVTSGGFNVAPVEIEMRMKTFLEACAQVILVGNSRNFLAMLVALAVDIDESTGLPTDRLSAKSIAVGDRIKSSARTYTEAKSDKRWNQYITDGQAAGNTNAESNVHIVKKWQWLPKDLSEKEGFLTPTMKIKRKVLESVYADIIDSMYADS